MGIPKAIYFIDPVADITIARNVQLNSLQKKTP